MSSLKRTFGFCKKKYSELGVMRADKSSLSPVSAPERRLPTKTVQCLRSLVLKPSYSSKMSIDFAQVLREAPVFHES